MKRLLILLLIGYAVAVTGWMRATIQLTHAHRAIAVLMAKDADLKASAEELKRASEMQLAFGRELMAADARLKASCFQLQGIVRRTHE